MIKNGSLQNIGVLLPYNTCESAKRGLGCPYLSVEYVKDYLWEKGVTCEFKYDDIHETKMDLDFHTDNPKVLTWWCAKGVQFKNVFILGCETEFYQDQRRPLYVAITRCSERLFLGFSSRMHSFFPDASSDLYYNPTENK